MKDDLDLEAQLKQLRPKPLPVDLEARMESPPARPFRWKRLVVPTLLLATAALWAFFVAPPSASPPPDQGPEPITIVQQRSSLIESRVIAVIEREGEAWEITEQEWLDEEIAICSTSPVEVRLTTTRQELICEPVIYY
jgi:hypothetical protein